MGLFDSIRRAVGGDSSTDDSADGGRRADDGPDLLETATLDPMAFRGYAERAVAGADPLTFDPDALARLDTAIEESDDWTTAGETASATRYTEDTVQFGSYLGELLVRAYDGEWVQSDGRWGVTVPGPDDAVTVAVFDVAARSFGDEPVFAAVATRLESELALDARNSAPAPPSDPDGATDPATAPSVERAETDATAATDAEPTRVVSRVADDSGAETGEDAASLGPIRPSVDLPEDGIDGATPDDEVTDGDSDASSPAPDAAAHGARDPQAESAAGDDVEPSARPWDPGTFRASHAETAVDFAAFWGEHDLDFTPPSLSRLDELVDAQWDAERFAETTFGSDDSFDDRAFTSVVRELGGYFGEVLVRHLDGEWTDETDHEAAVVVSGDEEQFAVPVFEVAMTSLRAQSVFGRSYDALLADLGRDGPRR